MTNDTVAACLAGMSEPKGLDFSSYVGLILGTGTNTCYAEDPAYIKNVPIRPGALPMIINTESGNYNRMPRGDFDRLFDQITMDPGRHMLEKMTSGGYLGALTDYIIRMSEVESLFSPGFYREYGQCERLDTADLGTDLGNRSVLPFVKEQPDREMLAYLFANMIERAAKLAALQAAGAAVKSGCGRDRRKPVCIMAEGSTFYKLKGLEGAFNATMKSGLQDEYGIYTHVMTMEDAVIKGAAIAGLLQ